MNNINKLITSTKDIDIAALANPHLKEQGSKLNFSNMIFRINFFTWKKKKIYAVKILI